MSFFADIGLPSLGDQMLVSQQGESPLAPDA